jgi:hypothetical protein
MTDDFPTSTIDPELQAEEDAAKYFIAAYNEASKYGMEREFVMYFLRSHKDGVSVQEAADAALLEWDL